MKEINLRELYPDTYNTDTFVEVADEVWAAISSSQRAEAAYERRKFRHKANYSLDYGNGTEKRRIKLSPPRRSCWRKTSSGSCCTLR